ncbi:polysaccharide deacetylase family protein [Castellaniella sp. GW247-6E4]|uniref:polysaccharide deacetylase family protein n=1 Tax=Castellaniella sp. GW247-6E4 TaxID=3140380 RepID=UPI003315E165
MASPTWHTSKALAWMQTLLRERFGHKFDLLVQPDERHIALRLPGHARCITLALDGVTFTRMDSDLPCALWDASAEGWAAALQEPLPAPGVESLPMPLIAKAAEGWHLDYDILGLAYWMLTRQEEVGRTDLDAHGRFPSKSSHALRFNYLMRPIVDEWLDILKKVIVRTWSNIELCRPQFSMSVSHDVDYISRYSGHDFGVVARSAVVDLIKRRDVRSISSPWIWLTSQKKLHNLDPYNTFDWIMDQSEYHGLTSAFYFICNYQRGGAYAPNYRIDHSITRNLMAKIYHRQHEIGLHPSYGSYLNPLQIKKETETLRTICIQESIKQPEFGGRMHFLQWRVPDTLLAWEYAGLAYDGTLAYADHPGFRAGTCHEYPAFDPVLKRPLDLRIRPLIVMEVAVMGRGGLWLKNPEDALNCMIGLKKKCKSAGGCFSLLWHNTSLINETQKYIYKNILKN